MNLVVLLGNLTRDPELRHTNNNTAVVSFGMANNRRYKAGDDMKEETTFVEVECWGRQAELVNEYCKKGKQVLVNGRLKLDQWEKDGEKRSKLMVVANNITFLGGNGNNNNEETPF